MSPARGRTAGTPPGGCGGCSRAGAASGGRRRPSPSRPRRRCGSRAGSEGGAGSSRLAVRGGGERRDQPAPRRRRAIASCSAGVSAGIGGERRVERVADRRGRAGSGSGAACASRAGRTQKRTQPCLGAGRVDAAREDRLARLELVHLDACRGRSSARSSSGAAWPVALPVGRAPRRRGRRRCSRGARCPRRRRGTRSGREIENASSSRSCALMRSPRAERGSTMMLGVGARRGARPRSSAPGTSVECSSRSRAEVAGDVDEALDDDAARA